jgi:hypothetical protein
MTTIGIAQREAAILMIDTRRDETRVDKEVYKFSEKQTHNSQLTHNLGPTAQPHSLSHSLTHSSYFDSPVSLLSRQFF